MMRWASFFTVGIILAACTGGGSSDTTSSGSTSSGSTSSGSTSSGSPAEGSVTPQGCTELPDGGAVSASLGGSQASQTKVQAALDYASAAASSARELTALCTQIATELGGSKSELDTANAEADDSKRISAVCSLAKNALMAERASDTIDLHASAADCTLPPTTSCEAGCVPASTGCTEMCNASAHAKATCPAPAIAATGASSTTLTATLNGHFGAVLALDARLRGMVDGAGTLASTMSSITDIKAACIPAVISTVTRSVQNVTSGVQATTDLKAAVGAS